MIVIDIETLPSQSADIKAKIAETIKAPAQMKKLETIEAWHNGDGKYVGEKDKAIEEKFLKTSFDGGYGSICCICIDMEGEEYTFSLADYDNERELLVGFWLVICEQSTRPYFIAHNAKFDLPFVWHRSVVLGVEPHKFFMAYGRHNSDYYCTMEAWAGFGGRISLDNLANILGLDGKADGMDGSQVWPEFQKGNIQKIADYCLDDVRLTKAVYSRLIFK